MEALIKHKDFKRTGFLRIFFNLAGRENRYTEQDIETAKVSI